MSQSIKQEQWQIPKLEISAIIKPLPKTLQYAHSPAQVHQAFLSIFNRATMPHKEESHVLLLAKDGRIIGTHKISVREEENQVAVCHLRL